MPNNIVRLTYIGDNKSALKATSEIETASTKSTDVIEDNNARAAKSADFMAEKVGGLGETFKNLAGTVGLLGVGFGMADLVKSGEQRQKQLTALAQTLKNTGQYHAGITDQIVSSSEQLSEHGGLPVEEQLSQIQALTSETGSLSSAQKANVAVQNIVRSGMMSQTQALKSYEGALDGTPGRLQKIIGSIIPVTRYTAGWTSALEQAYPAQYKHEEMLNKQATAAEVTAAVQKKLGGETAAYTHTTAGAVSNLDNTFGNLIDKLSLALLPTITKLVRDVADITEWFTKNRSAAIALGATIGALVSTWAALKVIGGITSLIKGVSTAYRELRTVMLAQNIVAKELMFTNAMVASSEEVLADATKGTTAAAWLLNAALDADPLILIVAAIAAVVAAVIILTGHTKWLTTAFKAVKTAAIDAFDFIKNIVSTVVTWVSQHWKLLILILGGPFLALPIFVATHFNQVKHWVTDLFDFVKQIFGKIAGVLEAPFKAAWKVVGPIINDIHKGIGAVGSILGTSGGGGLLHGFGLFHDGGAVHRATGGPIGGFTGLIPGYGGGDNVPLMAEHGEYVLRKEAVTSIGVSNLNSINQSGSLAAAENQGQNIVLYHTTKLGTRTLTQEVVHFSQRQAALTGAMGV